MLTPLP
jgi:chromosome segregation ATPase